MNENELHLNRNNFNAVNATNFLFSPLRTTPLLYRKTYFVLLNYLLAIVAWSDTPCEHTYNTHTHRHAHTHMHTHNYILINHHIHIQINATQASEESLSISAHHRDNSVRKATLADIQYTLIPGYNGCKHRVT